MGGKKFRANINQWETTGKRWTFNKNDYNKKVDRSNSKYQLQRTSDERYCAQDYLVITIKSYWIR